MSEDEHLKIAPLKSMWKGSDWRKRTCDDCEFRVETPKRNPNEPVQNECREGPPAIFTFPGLNALKQPILQLAAKYPGVPDGYPACSKFRQKLGE